MFLYLLIGCKEEAVHYIRKSKAVRPSDLPPMHDPGGVASEAIQDEVQQ